MWGARLILLIGLGFAAYGIEYGGGDLFAFVAVLIAALLLASFWRPRLGVLSAGGLLALLVFLQVLD